MSPGQGMGGDVILCPVVVRVQSRFEDSFEVCGGRVDRGNLEHSSVARLKELKRMTRRSPWDARATGQPQTLIFPAALIRRSKVARFSSTFELT